MTLDAWPDDLLLHIADEARNCADLNALVQTNRRLHGTLNDLLHTRFARTLWRWIAEHGVASSRQKRRLQLILLSERHRAEVEEDFVLARPWRAGPGPVTALSLASAKGHLESIKLYLGVVGINVNAADSEGYGRTPLSWAAEEGHADVVQLLLDTGGVDLDAREECGLTPLSRAAAQGHADVVRILLDTARVSLDAPLLYAAEEGHADVVQMLLDTGRGNVDAPGERGRTPLSLACAGGHADAVRVLLDTGRSTVDSPDEQSRTPLWWAVKGGHARVVRMLLDTGRVTVDSLDEQGRTPLWWAVREGHADVVHILDTGPDEPDPFNVGVIGYTASTKYFHIPLITVTPQFKLHSIAERNPTEVNSALLDHPEVTHHTDADALLSDPEVHIVVITTSCDTHFELTRAALEAGKHVLVEKPITHTSAEAESLMAVAKSCGRLVCVHQIRRWDPDFLVMKHLISNRVLGYVHEIRAHLDPCVASTVEELRTPSGGRAIFDLGTDLIDQLYSLFGMPVAVSRVSPSYLTTCGSELFVRLDYSNAMTVNIFINPSSPDPDTVQPRFDLRGTRGTFYTSGLNPQDWQPIGRSKPTSATLVGREKSNTMRLVLPDGSDGQIPELEEPETYGDIYAAFGRAVQRGKDEYLPVRVYEAREVLRIIEAIIRSGETRSSVYI